MYLIFRWALSAAALLLIAYLVPGVGVDSFFAALIAALVLGLANALVRPIIVVLTLPVTIVTLGLFLFIVNALMIWLTASVVGGFHVDGFVPALIAAILMWVVGLITSSLIKQAKKH